MSRVRFFAALSAALIALSAASCSHQIHVDDSGDTDVQTTATGEGEKETASVNKDKDTDDINSYIKVKKANPAMWKVTDPQTGNELYILGELRFATEYSFDLPDYVEEAYKNSSGLVVEFGVDDTMPDPDQYNEMYKHIIYNDGTTIKDHISEETYEIAKEYMSENAYYNDKNDIFTASCWASQVNGIAIGKVKNLLFTTLDAKFAERAGNDGKEIIGLEDSNVQFEAMDVCTDELSDFTIRRAKDIKAFTSNLAYQHDCWAEGDVDALDEEYYWSDRSADLDDDYVDYLEVSLYDRNVKMADKTEEFFKEGKNYFFVIGVTHFSGTRGIDDLLTEKGYKVEIVK